MVRSAIEQRAKAAADRLDAARDVGRQLSLLPAEASPADPAEIEPRGPGRPAGSRNRRTSKLRAMLAARGFRMPEDLVAETAGLGARGVTGVELAMQRAEQVAAWLTGDGYSSMKRAELMGLFIAIWKEQNAAAASLLPYGLEKLTPDAAPATVVPIVLPAASRPGDQARVIEHRPSELAPPPMPDEIEQDQALAPSAPMRSDDGSRTE
jgi:hypothetical protein